VSAVHDDLVKRIRIFISEIGGMSSHIETPGLLFDRNQKPVKIGKKGRLDIVATIKGRSVWIDAKIGKDRLKTDQQKFANAVMRAGGIAFAAWSVDDVKERLEKEGLI
jgi:hypothetical protein